MKSQQQLLQLIKDTLAPSTGCTEPAALAYGAALARSHQPGEIESMEILLNSYIYKNAMGVSIPGFDKKGVAAAAALGLAIGDAKAGLNLLENVTEEQIDVANELIAQNKVTFKMLDDCDVFFAQFLLCTSQGNTRVTLAEKHQQAVEILKDSPRAFDPTFATEYTAQIESAILSYSLEEMVEFAKVVPVEELEFLNGALAMNCNAATAGFELMKKAEINLESAFRSSGDSGDVKYNPAALCMAASYARMSGQKIPVMTCTGSGNHGITLFLVIHGFASRNEISEEEQLRAMALGCLLNLYIKTHTGLLSAMCGCGIAAGIGASAGIVLMEGGTIQQIEGAVRNLIGSISGIICDGAKEGCAYKLALVAGWSVQAAELACHGALIGNDGIVNEDFPKMIANLGRLSRQGMADTNKMIIQTIAE